MQKQRKENKRGVVRLSTLPLVSAMTIAIAGCGQPSGANANQAAENRAVSSIAATAAKATPADVASAILPPAVLAAWEKRAGCSAKEARAVPSRWAAYPSVRNDETVIDLYERHFAKYSGGFVMGDFNGDGQRDFIIVAPSGCGVHDPDERMDYGSRGGPPADFVISSPSGYRAIEGFQSFIDASMIKRRDNKDVLEFNANGYSGSCGYVETSVWGWNGKQMVVVEQRDDKGQVVDREGCPVKAQTAAAGPAGFPPIPKGYYAVGSSCARAIANFESDPFGLTFIDDRKMLTAGMLLHEITKVEALGANRFRLKMQTEGEDGNMHPADMVVTLTGPSSFVSDDSAPPMGNHAHCPDNSVPKSIRDQFANYGR